MIEADGSIYEHLSPDMRARNSSTSSRDEGEASVPWIEKYESTWSSLMTLGLDNSRPQAANARRMVPSAQRNPLNVIDVPPMRNAVIVLDLSEGGNSLDYKPSVSEFTKMLCDRMCEQYLSGSPLSKIGIVIINDGRAKIHSPLSYVAPHTAEIKDQCRGPPCFSDAVELACSMLHRGSSCATRELFILWSSVTVAIGSTESIKSSLTDVSVRVLSVTPELHVLKTIALESKGGEYHVALDADHAMKLSELVALNPPTISDFRPLYVQIGFPQSVSQNRQHQVGVCICHGNATTRWYVCPRCSATVCSLPRECPACDLPLLDAQSLSRIRWRSDISKCSPVLREPNTTGSTCSVCAKSVDKDQFFTSCCLQVLCQACSSAISQVVIFCPVCS